MIYKNDNGYCPDETEELEIASNNLPNNLAIFLSYEPNFESFDEVEMILIPYDKNRYTSSNDMLLSDGFETKFGKIDNSKDTIGFDGFDEHCFCY